MRNQPRGSYSIVGEYFGDDTGTHFERVYSATGEVTVLLHAATADIVKKAKNRGAILT